MTARSELLDHLLDCLMPLGHASGRSMFGGHGLYLDGTIVGIVIDETLYLKVDDGNRPDFEAAGTGPFVYYAQDRPVALSYWEAPAELFEDPEPLRGWVLKALAAARRAQSRKKPRRRSRA